MPARTDSQVSQVPLLMSAAGSMKHDSVTGLSTGTPQRKSVSSETGGVAPVALYRLVCLSYYTSYPPVMRHGAIPVVD